MNKPMFWEKLSLGDKEEIFPTTRVGACLLYIPERKSYLLFGGENNTVQNQLNRMQSKQPPSPTKSLVKDTSMMSSQSGLSTKNQVFFATGKNDKIYFYNIGIFTVKSIFYIETNKWTIETTKGKFPEFRTFFAYYYNGKFYIAISQNSSVFNNPWW